MMSTIKGFESIPMAKNIVQKKRSTLALATPEDMARSLSSPSDVFDPSSLNVGSFSSGMYSYSKEDAVQKAWLSTAGHITIKGEVVGPVRGPFPTDEFREQLSQNGISAEPDWFSLGWDFSLLSEDKPALSIDYMASRYAAVKTSLLENFSGETLDGHLSKLEETMGKAINAFAQKFSDKVGGYLDDLGADGEREKIYNSVFSEVSARADAYLQYAQKNPDYAGLSGTEDAWLKNDSAYMAARLRESGAANRTEASSDRYSLTELSTLSKITNDMRSKEFRANSSGFEDEESMGYGLGALYLKFDSYAQSRGVRDSLRDSIRTAMDSYINRYLEETDKHLKNRPRMIASDRQGFGSLMKNDALSIYQSVKESYDRTGDVSKTLREEAQKAKAQYEEKQFSGKYSMIYRYKGSGYWNSFYKDTSLRRYRESTIQTITREWIDFFGDATAAPDFGATSKERRA